MKQLMELLVKQLMELLAIRLTKQKTLGKSLVIAIPLGCQRTTTKWLVISNQKTVAKWLVISQGGGVFSRLLSRPESTVLVKKSDKPPC